MSFTHRVLRLPWSADTDPESVLLAYAGPGAIELFRHRWTPQGLTVVAMRSGATFVLHTWPERNLSTLDIIEISSAQPSADGPATSRGEG